MSISKLCVCIRVLIYDSPTPDKNLHFIITNHVSIYCCRYNVYLSMCKQPIILHQHKSILYLIINKYLIDYNYASIHSLILSITKNKLLPLKKIHR